MNVLIIGFGSIGQRHLNNLLTVRPENNYFVLKNSKSDVVIQDCKLVENTTIYNYYDKVGFFHNIGEINLHDVDTAFICNDSSKHLDMALQLLEYDIDYPYYHKY